MSTTLEELAAAQRELEDAERALELARAHRDDLVRQGGREGLSGYRMAKTIGVAETTVTRILRK